MPASHVRFFRDGNLLRPNAAVWMDADVLVLDKTQPLGSVIAGVLGFRRTDANREMPERLRQLIEGATTYSRGSDQTVIAKVLKELGWSASLNVDILSLNTPGFFRQPASFMVHDFGIWTD